jgi:hypothetical protein
VNQDWFALIQKIAKGPGLDWRLVAAFMQVESGGNPYAMRYESEWKYLEQPEMYAKDLGITTMTETMLQCFSYGLLQVMGGTARGMGYKDHLPMLCQPEVGLLWGCMLLSRNMNKYPVITDVISAYNAGTPRKTNDGKYVNQIYVDKVMGNYAQLKQ